MKNTFKKFAAALAVSAATSTAAMANDDNRFHVSPADFAQMVKDIGCNPIPTRLRWVWGVPREEQPYTDAERDKSSFKAWHCEQYNSVNESSDIATLLQDAPQAAILALRAVSDDQVTERNSVARATAIEMARYTVDYAFEGRLGNHRDMPRFYRELNALLDKIPTEPVSFDQYREAHPEMRYQSYKMQREAKANYDTMETVHQRAYDIRLELDRRNFHASIVQAAQAVVMASSVGNPYLGLPNERDWAALFGTYDAMESAVIYRRDKHSREGRQETDQIVTDKAREFLVPTLTK